MILRPCMPALSHVSPSRSPLVQLLCSSALHSSHTGSARHPHLRLACPKQDKEDYRRPRCHQPAGCAGRAPHFQGPQVHAAAFAFRSCSPRSPSVSTCAAANTVKLRSCLRPVWTGTGRTMTGERAAVTVAVNGARAAAAVVSGITLVSVQIHGIFGSMRRRQSKGDTFISQKQKL
jgi:hypothetical protein